MIYGGPVIGLLVMYSLLTKLSLLVYIPLLFMVMKVVVMVLWMLDIPKMVVLMLNSMISQLLLTVKSLLLVMLQLLKPDICQKVNTPDLEKLSLIILEMLGKPLLLLPQVIVEQKIHLGQFKTLECVVVQIKILVGNLNSLSMMLLLLLIISNSVLISV